MIFNIFFGGIYEKNVKKAYATLAAATILATSMGAQQVSADWFTSETTASALGKSFSKKWDKDMTFEFDCDGLTLTSQEVTVTVGYDTWWTKEDYVNDCYAPTGWSHYAYVVNSDNEVAYTKTAKGGCNTNKADVKHTGNSVTYGVAVNIG